MQKFILKFLLLFVISISLVFFLLIFFQKPPEPPIDSFYMNEGLVHNQDIPKPPIYIPCFIIIALSSLFIFCLLKHINKNFIIPLNEIENNLQIIKKGSLDVLFQTKSENKKIQETFSTLNDMVLGLKQKERLKENFIQNLTHDLRSPIIAQERAIAILQEEFAGHELLDGMMKNSETYLKMINLIIEAYNDKEIEINKTDIYLQETVNNIFDALSSLAKDKNINLKHNISNSFTIWADYISINRIIMNLVSNAIENIENNKTITISAFKEKNISKIIIEDNGSGIDKSEIENIFNKYYSNKKSGKKSISGLGLYIVKELVTKQNGKIYIESEKNLYTKFIIELPNKD